jgi:hypothetical protein
MPAALWTHRLAATPGGVALARESGHVLAWDQNCWLVLLGRNGNLQGQTRLDAGIAAATISDDGSAVVDADDRGTVAWRTPDLAVRWQHRLDRRPTNVALDTLGRAVAVADNSGAVRLFTAEGHSPWPPMTLPRPIIHLTFAPTAPALFAAADFGLVTCLDLGQRRAAWQDAPVVHVGSLAVTGLPVVAVAACYSEGLRRYALTGTAMALPNVPTPEPCRFVAATFAGDQFLVGGVFGGLHRISADGTVLSAEKMDQPIAGLAWRPRGESAVIALADGRVVGMASVGA